MYNEVAVLTGDFYELSCEVEGHCEQDFRDLRIKCDILNMINESSALYLGPESFHNFFGVFALIGVGV